MALAASLFWAGGGDTDAVATLQSTTADLDRRLTATEGQAGEVGALTERLAVIETAPALSGADGGGDVGDLVGRLDEVEQQFASLADAVDQATTAGAADGSSDMIAGLTDRLGAAEQELADLKLAIAEAAEKGQAANDGIAAIQTAIPGIEAMLASTGSTVEENGQQAAALGLSVEALNQTTEQLGGDISTLFGRVGEAENQLAYMGGEYQRAAAMVVTIGDIDRAIAKAEPFEQALQSLAALGQDDAAISEALSTLQPMAADGVPTLAGLQSSFGETGSRILLAEDGNETLADKVSGNVFSIINMRPSGAEVEGDNSRAIVARAQAKLSGNDLEGTIAELGVLEGSAAESAGDWIAKASDRLAADAAIADLRAHAQSLLAKGS